MASCEDSVPYLKFVENRWVEYAEDADDVLPTP